jgi:uncharacterized membrane protein
VNLIREGSSIEKRSPKEKSSSVKQHPLHPMLVGLPIGLWVFALVSDIVFAAGGATTWNTVALYCIGAGVLGALLAAVPGFIDYLSMDEAQMKRLGTYHLLLNLGAVVLFAINFWLRFRLPDTSRLPLALSILGVAGIALPDGSEVVKLVLSANSKSTTPLPTRRPLDFAARETPLVIAKIPAGALRI